MGSGLRPGPARSGRARQRDRVERRHTAGRRVGAHRRAAAVGRPCGGAGGAARVLVARHLAHARRQRDDRDLGVVGAAVGAGRRRRREVRGALGRAGDRGRRRARRRVIVSAEAIGVSRAITSADGYKIDVNRDLVAFGGSNLLAGLSSGFVQSSGASQPCWSSDGRLSPRTLREISRATPAEQRGPTIALAKRQPACRSRPRQSRRSQPSRH
jgi:hypothetical protein